jgi:uncharacterized protein (DUF885 family)
VTALADAYLAAYFDRYPEFVTYYSVPGGRHDRMRDNSLAAHERWEAQEDQWLATLRSIDHARLAGRPEWVTYGTLREVLEASTAGRVCHNELWGVTQTAAGWQAWLAYLSEVQPIGTDDLRAQALARWRGIPRFIDLEVEKLREGVRRGYAAPKGNVRLVIGQMDALLSTPAIESPFYSLAARDSTPTFETELKAIVATGINPAIRRFRDFLEREYLPRAREAIAVSANPNGAMCYRAAVRNFSTLDLSPRQIHELGLEQVAKLDAEMLAIARRSFGASEVPPLLERLKTDPKYTFRTGEEVVSYSEEALGRAKTAIGKWFGILPKADVVIRRYPAFRERSAAGEYHVPAEDGSRPGAYFILTYDPTKRSRSGSQSVTFHETIPGHHLQIAIAMERKSAIHPIARYLRNAGYTEGWALYAERLADEMGLYSSDLDRMGMLSDQRWRAARLVVDPGIHVLGWTRERAIKYLLANTTASRDEVEAEVDRYIIWPGQATAYMLGMLEIRQLRDGAESALGPRFDIREFHDRVLEDGSLTLPMLRDKIERWIAEARVSSR